MGGAPNYGKGRAFMQRMVDAERRNREQNIMVKQGKGRYPKCLPDKPYTFCPKETPEDPKNIPQDCKFCPHFIYSKFYSMQKMNKLSDEEIILKINTIIDSIKNDILNPLDNRNSAGNN